jgi:NTP pyrophosphatase (non-canonical NTP hydrolase)
MNTKDFEEVTWGRKRETFDPLEFADQHTLHGAIGLVGEAAEVMDIIKKSVYKSTPVDAAKVVDECGDCLFYLAMVLKSVNSSLDEAMTVNNKKLELRYGKSFSTDKFLNINKAKEAEILKN